MKQIPFSIDDKMWTKRNTITTNECKRFTCYNITSSHRSIAFFRFTLQRSSRNHITAYLRDKQRHATRAHRCQCATPLTQKRLHARDDIRCGPSVAVARTSVLHLFIFICLLTQLEQKIELRVRNSIWRRPCPPGKRYKSKRMRKPFENNRILKHRTRNGTSDAACLRPNQKKYNNIWNKKNDGMEWSRCAVCHIQIDKPYVYWTIAMGFGLSVVVSLKDLTVFVSCKQFEPLCRHNSAQSTHFQ